MASEKPSLPDPLTLPEAVDELERGYLRRALQQARFNQRRAAEILGLRYHQFRGLYRKHRDVLEQKESADSEKLSSQG